MKNFIFIQASMLNKIPFFYSWTFEELYLICLRSSYEEYLDVD